MPLVGVRRYTAHRRGPVVWGDDGEPVRPAAEEFQVRLSVQPMNGYQLQRLPEGLRARKPKKAYGYRREALRTVQGVGQEEADLVLIEGELFEVHQARDYGDHAPLPHLRYELYAAQTDEDLEVGP